LESKPGRNKSSHLNPGQLENSADTAKKKKKKKKRLVRSKREMIYGSCLRSHRRLSGVSGLPHDL
jgi:hypothetical protein